MQGKTWWCDIEIPALRGPMHEDQAWVQPGLHRKTLSQKTKEILYKGSKPLNPDTQPGSGILSRITVMWTLLPLSLGWLGLQVCAITLRFQVSEKMQNHTVPGNKQQWCPWRARCLRTEVNVPSWRRVLQKKTGLHSLPSTSAHSWEGEEAKQTFSKYWQLAKLNE